MIIASGGTVHSIKKAMFWESYGKIMSPWIQKAAAIKKEGQLHG